ncbi:hypothetical protein KVV02_005872 [Mortierella alpina]|uniref:Uncharacterized protein n=1 Tax=Mortierella alpina TaxID=64518 RepID=A0A9P7ZYY2_MORAP|nr:hypothetical protein KVV02_005872 [Mortierella alpina]
MHYGEVLTQPQFWKTFFTRNRYSHDEIPDLSDKVAIVTGANSGLGYATTVALAGHGAHVFLACRSRERAMDAIKRARKEIREKFKHVQEPILEFLELDLNDMNKARQAAQSFLSKGLPLHILINNSGMVTPSGMSADGIEQQFAVNHLGHFVFTINLLDKIKESQPSRIVILASMGHECTVPGGIDFDSLNDESKSSPLTRYGRSKLANILFGRALARRMADERVYVNIAHPGLVKTELMGHANEIKSLATMFFDKMTNTMAMMPETGALTQLYLATSPEIVNRDIRGRYFVPIANEIQPSSYARDDDLGEKLWTFSEQLTREKLRD